MHLTSVFLVRVTKFVYPLAPLHFILLHHFDLMTNVSELFRPGLHMLFGLNRVFNVFLEPIVRILVLLLDVVSEYREIEINRQLEGAHVER